jgi:hypothetical protein
MLYDPNFYVNGTFKNEPRIEFHKSSSLSSPLRPISLLFCHLTLGLENRLIPSSILTKTPCDICFYFLPVTFSALRTLLIFGHLINTRRVRGLCDGLITRPEESYRLWRVVVCDQETSKTRSSSPLKGCGKYNDDGL